MIKNILQNWIFSKKLTTILIFSIPIFSQDFGIAIDLSGSMRGYFNSNSIYEFVSQLDSVVKEGEFTTEKYYFLEEELIPYYNNPREFGLTTKLDIAFQNLVGRGHKAIVIITDNLQQGNIDSITTISFYDKLLNSDVRRAYLIPKLLDFNGSIRVMYRRYPYSGPRGLLCYFFLLDQNFIYEFTKTANAFSEEDVLLIKPITKREIQLVGVSKSQLSDVQMAVSKLLNECPDTKINKLPYPNTKVSTTGQLSVMDPENPPEFDFSSENIINFYFTLKSKLDHINIGFSEDPCSRSIQFNINNLVIYSKNSADRNFFRKTKLSGRILPPALIGKLESHQQNVFFYYGEIKFGPFDINWGINNLFKYLRFSNIPISIIFDVNLTVPEDQFTLTDNYRDKYFTDDLMKFDKIYSPVDIIQYINRQPVTIKFKVGTN